MCWIDQPRIIPNAMYRQWCRGKTTIFLIVYLFLIYCRELELLAERTFLVRDSSEPGKKVTTISETFFLIAYAFFWSQEKGTIVIGTFKFLICVICDFLCMRPVYRWVDWEIIFRMHTNLADRPSQIFSVIDPSGLIHKNICHNFRNFSWTVFALTPKWPLISRK